MSLSFTFTAALLCGILLAASLVAARQVNVDVSVEWPRYEYSLTAEVSEFLAHESPQLFWDYSNKLCALPKGSLRKGSSAAYEAAQGFLPKPLHGLLDTVLGMSVYAPAVEFFRALSTAYSPEGQKEVYSLAGDPCGGSAWAVVFPGRQVLCEPSAEELEEALEASAALPSGVGAADVTFGHSDAEGELSWDHQWVQPTSHSHTGGASASGGGGAQSRSRVVLYGSLGSASFCAWHSVIVAAVTPSEGAQQRDGRLATAYSARHAFAGSQSVAASTHLQGFGVYLDIKNMEYKNVDDADADPDADAPAHAEVTPVKAEQETVPTDADASPSDADEEQEGEEDMKLSRMRDLGVQTVHSILGSDVRLTVPSLPFLFFFCDIVLGLGLGLAYCFRYIVVSICLSVCLSVCLSFFLFLFLFLFFLSFFVFVSVL